LKYVSPVADSGTGNLKIYCVNLELQATSTGETYFNAIANGAVTLYHDNATKLATTATGIDVTGTATMDGLTLESALQYEPTLRIKNTNPDANASYFVMQKDTASPAVNDVLGSIFFQGNDNASNPTNYASIEGISSNVTDGAEQGTINIKTAGGTGGQKTRITVDGNGDISFYEDTGTTAMFFWDASLERLGIGTASPDSALEVRGDVGSSGTVAKIMNSNSTYSQNLDFNFNSSKDVTLQTGSSSGGIVLEPGTRGVTINESGGDKDFRVESNSDTHALFVDASTNRVGISTSAPPVQFTVGGGDGTAELLLWGSNANSTSSRLIFGGQDPYTSEFIQFRYDSDNNLLQLETDTSFGVGKIVQFDRQYGRVTFNEDSAADADFRVESNNNSYMLHVDASLDAVAIGTVIGASYQASQQGMLQVRNGGSQGSPSGSGGIEFYAAQANNGYSHRLCAFDNTGGDTPLVLQRRNNSATWVTQVTFEGINNNVVFAGTVSKGGGSFKIDHPLPSMNSTHHLVHSFIEGPQADNLYRGRVSLVAGQASVNLDTASNMTEGTFVLLNRDVQCFTSNETGWTAVKGTVTGNTLLIEAQDNTCTDTVSWMVVGERQDQFMYDNEFADEDGHIIVEPLKKPHQQNA